MTNGQQRIRREAYKIVFRSAAKDKLKQHMQVAQVIPQIKPLHGPEELALK